MKRLVAVCLLGLASVLSYSVPAFAASGARTTNAVDWNQRDTAVYVVSTLNLFRTHNGRPASATYARRYGVTRYSVLADPKSDGLYFVELKRDDGSIFGVYAYQMGWAKPAAVSISVERFGARPAPGDVVSDYRSDPKVLLATFTSTLPQ